MHFVKEHGATDVRPANVRVSAGARWKMALFSAVYLAIAMPHLFAAEQTHTTEHESGQYHRNMVELFLGNTYEDAHDETENGFTVGFTYERRLSGLLGVGGFYEHAAGDFDQWSIGVPLIVHPYGGWRLAFAPGLEHREGNDEFLFRTGVAYEFALSERWAMIPEFNVDFVDGEAAFVFGLSFGFGC